MPLSATSGSQAGLVARAARPDDGLAEIDILSFEAPLVKLGGFPWLLIFGRHSKINSPAFYHPPSLPSGRVLVSRKF